MEQKPQKTRVIFPIGAKLVIIISILFLVSLGTVILMVSVLSTQEVQKTAEDNNFTVNSRAASQAEGSFKSIQASVLLYLEMTDRVSAAFHRDPEMEKYFFGRNKNIAAIGVTGSFFSSEDKEGFIPNPQFFNSTDIGIGDAEAYLASDFTATEDQIMLFNASPVFGLSLITAVFVRQGREGVETVKLLFTPDDLSESFGTGTNTSFLINNPGDLLLHSDSDLVLNGANFSAMPLVAIMQQQGDNNRQVSYDDGGMKYFGAYCRIAGTDAVVITTIPHNIVFEAVQGITRQNIYLAAAVMFIAIIFIWFFSKTISGPVKSLADAALKIEEGDFSVYLKPQTRDEVGLLTESFDNMTRVLSVFGRFTNKDIAIRAMRGEIKPGGLPRHATILFSDIRDFAEKTEGFSKAFGADAPNKIVLWLNNYFSRMIGCVEKTEGVVDKFIGDALMAHWGAASTTGDHAADAYKSVKTALLMRQALIEINAQRKDGDPENPKIRIGCGINTGMVIAGQIGSEERMEYTVIGEPVNIANRIEALNKPFGTDILISEDTWKLIGDIIITEEMLPVKVKGREEPVRVFAVINLVDADGPQTLDQVRAILGIGVPDVRDLNLYEEEKKYEIQERRSKNDRRQSSGQDRRNFERGSGNTANTAAGPGITMTSFGSSSIVHGPAGKLVPVFFAWNTSNLNPDTHVIVEVAEDMNFNSILEDREIVGSFSVSIPLKGGMYWWRVYPVTGGSRVPIIEAYPSGVLTVSTDAKEKFKIQSN